MYMCLIPSITNTLYRCNGIQAKFNNRKQDLGKLWVKLWAGYFGELEETGIVEGIEDGLILPGRHEVEIAEIVQIRVAPPAENTFDVGRRAIISVQDNAGANTKGMSGEATERHFVFRVRGIEVIGQLCHEFKLSVDFMLEDVVILVALFVNSKWLIERGGRVTAKEAFDDANPSSDGTYFRQIVVTSDTFGFTIVTILLFLISLKDMVDAMLLLLERLGGNVNIAIMNINKPKVNETESKWLEPLLLAAIWTFILSLLGVAQLFVLGVFHLTPFAAAKSTVKAKDTPIMYGRGKAIHRKVSNITCLYHFYCNRFAFVFYILPFRC